MTTRKGMHRADALLLECRGSAYRIAAGAATIARLPFEIREELNHKLKDNVPVKDILNWLNTHSTVRHYMDRLFQSRYITEQNVSEWRQGGHQEWLTYLSCIEDVRDLTEDSVRVALTDITGEHLLLARTAMFARMVKNMEQTPEIAFNRKLIVVQHMIKTALSLRRSEQKDERLKIDRDRLELLRQKKGDKSPSSYPPSPYETRVSSYSSLRTCHPHPLHPRAPEIHRPPAPIDPDLYAGDPDWPPTPPVFDNIGPDPDEPPEPDAGPDGPYAPASPETLRPSSRIPCGEASETNSNYLD